MDYEKKYKEALERAKVIYQGSYKPDTAATIAETLQNVFPELTKSEDEKTERISKEIIKYLERTVPHNHRDEVLKSKEWIAWLEKQGEQRRASIWKHWKDGICGNGEGKLIYLIKDGNDYRLSSSLGYECDYIELSELGDLMYEKQAEVESDNDDIEAEEKDIRKAFKKIWEEKQSVQNTAWSEEDEVKINRIVACLENLNVSDNDILLKDVDWLKSLKDRAQPQNRWKPSNEQMKALADALSLAKNCGEESAFDLRTLYEQLKKL